MPLERKKKTNIGFMLFPIVSRLTGDNYMEAHNHKSMIFSYSLLAFSIIF